MDADFLVHDTYAMTRPQWKIASDLPEAAAIFGEAVAQNYKTQDADAGRTMEADDEDAESSSSDEDENENENEGEGEGLEDDAMPEVAEGPDGDEEQESSDEAGSGEQAADDSDESEDEQIFVSRQEEERDPAAEAEFDRELERLMADSVESRRFERKAIFDVPLPMRRAPREPGSENMEAPMDSAPAPAPEPGPASASGSGSGSQMPPNTMAFSLMTKKGNKQQTRTIDLPSDSTFALAMRTQQQADREEQQRIKNLVLNYEKSTETENGECS